MLKCSFVSFATTPDSVNSAIKFGIAISPLKATDRFHTILSEVVVPIALFIEDEMLFACERLPIPKEARAVVTA